MGLGRRSNQEDARYPDRDAPLTRNSVFVVCDGVGGQDKGEVASRTVASTVGKCMEHYDSAKPFSAADFESVLRKVHRELTAAASGGKLEMATTMTMVYFHSGGVFTAHIGDSRIYHIRPGVGILHRSDDHSLVNALVHSGNLTPEEAIDHPQSNIITRCLSPGGNDDSASVSTLQIRDVEPGDYFFLCTDGVTGCVSDEQLYEILGSSSDDEAKIDIIESLSAGSPDNNTAYLIGVEDVIYDLDEESEPELDEAVGNLQQTAPLKSPNETVVEAERRKSSGISGFIKGMFK